MSRTTLYKIQPDGELAVLAEYQNSHGFAPAIWSVLVAKYVPNGMPLGGDQDQRMRWIMDGRKTWLMDDKYCFGHMGPASRDGTMIDSDALCYAITLDFAAVAREDAGMIADALDKFRADHGDSGDPLGHLASMASRIRAAAAEADLYGAEFHTIIRGVCWNATSLGDTFARWVGDDDGDDSRSYNFDLDDEHFWVGPGYLRQDLLERASST